MACLAGLSFFVAATLRQDGMESYHITNITTLRISSTVLGSDIKSCKHRYRYEETWDKFCSHPDS